HGMPTPTVSTLSLHDALPIWLIGVVGRRSWGPLVVGAVGLALAALLAPSEPVALPLEQRWLAAFLLFVVIPGWLFVGVVLRPTRSEEHTSELQLLRHLVCRLL